jgi:hypothetical protein
MPYDKPGRIGGIIVVAPLNEKQEAFCRHYVANGGNGAKAARDAGFAEKSAHVTASRLLKDDRVQLRIAVLRAGQKGGTVAFLARPDTGGAGGGFPPLDGDILRPGDDIPDPPRSDAAKAIDLTRNYIVANLMENVEIAMGRQPLDVLVAVKRTVTKKITRSRTPPPPGSGEGEDWDVGGVEAVTETVSAKKVRVTDRNGAVANVALKLLSEQLELIRKEGGTLNEENSERTAQYLDRETAAKYDGLRGKMRAAAEQG